MEMLGKQARQSRSPIRLRFLVTGMRRFYTKMVMPPPVDFLTPIHAPSAKLISGESNIVEMLLQFPALLQHATATSADRNTAM